MTLKDGDAEDDSAEIDAEDDSAEIDELLAELDENEGNSRYDNLHTSNGSHTKAPLDTSIMHTQDSKGNTHDKEEEKTPHAQLHLAHMRTDASNNTIADTPPMSPSKFSPTHHPEMRVFAVDMPPSPPPSPPPPCGCSCFLLPSHKRVKKQKKSSAEDRRSSKIKATIPKGKTDDDDDNDDNDEWQSVVKETGPQHMDAGGLFDVKSTEREFKRASMKEKQLTQEAQQFLKMVAMS